MLTTEKNQKISLEEQLKKRNYGIDLLRLVSMFMVIILHVLGQGGILANSPSLTFRGEFFWSIEIMCYCAVNIFAIISGYVGLRAKHKYHSLISVTLELIFYAIVITIIDLIVLLSTKSEITAIRVLSNLFPSVGSMWYFSAYFCLFFFMPLLNAIVETVDRNTLKKVAVFIFIVFCCCTQFISRVTSLGGGYTVIWLAILYVLGAYMAKYDFLHNLSIKKSLIGYFLCVAITVLCRVIMGNIYPSGANVLVSYTSPTIVLCAVFLVNVFAKIRVRPTAEKVISFLSPMAFGVYLVHCHPLVFRNLGGVFAWIAEKPTYFALPLILAAGLTIFVACVVVIWIRILLFKLLKVSNLATAIEKALKKLFSSILKLIKADS